MFKRVYLVDVDAGRVTERIENPGKLGQVRLESRWSAHRDGLGRGPQRSTRGAFAGRRRARRRTAPRSDARLRGPCDVLCLAGCRDVGVGGRRRNGDARGYGNAGRSANDGVGTGRADPGRNCHCPRDGTVISLSGHTPTHPPEVFSIATAGAASPATDARQSLARPKCDSRGRRPSSGTARDGLQLQGVLIYPLNYVAGRRYPLIMSVHGGPESHEPNGWLTSYSRPGQVAAARGFAVFYPNYRGSTGRGVDFSKLGQADAAGKEFDDLIDGIDHLVASGLVDTERVGITGGSYGGYASAWGATYYSERFAASVMFVGISDNVSKLGTTDIPEEMYLVHHRKRLWEDWDYFLERSPIRHVQKNRTRDADPARQERSSRAPVPIAGALSAPQDAQASARATRAVRRRRTRQPQGGRATGLSLADAALDGTLSAGSRRRRTAAGS